MKTDGELLLDLLGEGDCCPCGCDDPYHIPTSTAVVTQAGATSPAHPMMLGKKMPPITVTDDNLVFVPAPLASLGSPQRPGNWGTVHRPQVNAAGVFLRGEDLAMPSAGASLVVVSDLGVPLAIPAGAPLQVDHDARTLKWRFTEPTGAASYGSLALAQTALTPGDRVGFNGSYDVFVQGAADGTATQAVQSSEVVYSYSDGSVTSSVLETATSSYSVGSYTLRVRESGFNIIPSQFRFVGLAGTGNSSDVHLEADLGGGRWVQLPVANNSNDYRFPSGLPAGTPTVGAVFTRFAVAGGSSSGYSGPAFPDGVQWRSGGITVEGSPGPLPAVLTGRTLHAFGQVVSGASWAALRGATGETVLLIESGANVTRLDASGQTTITRATLEALLGDTLSRFADVGPLSNTWPPEWAWAICTEARALTAWEPWRDTPRSAWVSAGKSKPKRRPLTVLPADQIPPTPPLSLALADVGGVLNRCELLRRAQAPFLLPSQVEMFDEQAQAWQVSASALAALRKRTLYPQANWPEELNDRTYVSGSIRVQFQSSALTAAQNGITLLLRVRDSQPARRVALPGLAITDPLLPAPLYLLGHDAGDPQRLTAWHPATLTFPGTWTPDAPPTITLNLPAGLRLSRLLLCLTGVPLGGGGSS